MNPDRLNAYLSLIQELLSCPSNEEWICLRQHEDLVDAELVQVMEQVASQMKAQGNGQAAQYLHNWAGQLHHMMVRAADRPQPQDRSAAYAQLLEALLLHPERSEHILAAHPDLLGPGLVQTMKQAAGQLAERGDRPSATFLSRLADELIQSWLQAHAFQPNMWTKPTAQGRRVGTDPPPDASDRGAPAPVGNGDGPDIADRLQAIATALTQLCDILAVRSTFENPLAYMEILERACACNWSLTTQEIESLIGTKPRCATGENTFQRGCWTFVKADRIGTQVGWRVEKQV